MGVRLVSSTQPKRGSRFVFVPSRAGQTSWRLLAANNRPLALATEHYSSSASAKADARLLLSECARLVPSVAVDANGRWRWTVSLDGRPLASSPNGYFRRLEVGRAMANFLTTLSTAAPAFDTPGWALRTAAGRRLAAQR